MTGDFCGHFVSIIPSIGLAALKKKSMVGWGGVRVGIIDSGVSGIECLEKKDFSGSGCEDSFGHGTRVAAIIKHIAKGASIISLKTGVQKPDEMNTIRALEWAIDNKLDIVNISSGFLWHTDPNKDCPLCNLVNIAVNEGTIVVVAAGNNTVGKIIPTINCPGMAESAVTVSAIDKFDALARYACIGKPGWDKPNVLAPGSCYVDDVYDEGTSFSTPVVAGVCAAILSRFKNPLKSVDYIYNTARDIGLPRHLQGHGVLCLERLVEAIENETLDCKCSGQELG